MRISNLAVPATGDHMGSPLHGEDEICNDRQQFQLNSIEDSEGINLNYSLFTFHYSLFTIPSIRLRIYCQHSVNDKLTVDDVVAQLIKATKK